MSAHGGWASGTVCLTYKRQVVLGLADSTSLCVAASRYLFALNCALNPTYKLVPVFVLPIGFESEAGVVHL